VAKDTTTRRLADESAATQAVAGFHVGVVGDLKDVKEMLVQVLQAQSTVAVASAEAAATSAAATAAAAAAAPAPAPAGFASAAPLPLVSLPPHHPDLPAATAGDWWTSASETWAKPYVRSKLAVRDRARTHARTHTRTHARTHARMHARTHARTHASS